ncbi:Transmembrane protein 81, partial [Mesitornis unicolor]
VLGALLCASYLPLVFSVQNVTIPAELKSVVGKVAVNATSCSVTCGLGFKVEEMCVVTPSGERMNCTLRRTDCLMGWDCGLLHFTVPAGRPFRFSCRISHAAGVGHRAYSYTWTHAHGIITTNDVLFRPLRYPGSVIRFSSTEESHAGTYRCDVRMAKTFRVVKRIYFGVSVIHSDLVDLNFKKSLTWEQKLAASKEEGDMGSGTYEEAQEKRPFWQEKTFHEGLMGVGSGVAAGALLSMAL